MVKHSLVWEKNR